jgi:16S rRNA A1518/A1519 N6-dimethyltransferase RsmA/KsgA/DIM1 with predicted DNA glycosylase/AP lyase activity
MESLILVLGVLGFFIFFLWIFVSFSGAPFEPTNGKNLRRIVKLSKIKKREKVADIGSGNGKIVIEFAKKGIESHGFEINPFLVFYSRRKIKKLNLEKKAFIHFRNFWKQDFSKFNVVIVFQIGYIMEKLERKLKRELKKGSRVVSNTWKFPNWKIKKHEGEIYLYEI